MDDGWHFSLTSDGKSKLVGFVEENAVFSDMSVMIETLKSLRYHVGLAPDGEP